MLINIRYGFTLVRAVKRPLMDTGGLPWKERGLQPFAGCASPLLLGDGALVARHHTKKSSEVLREVSKTHRRLLALPLHCPG